MEMIYLELYEFHQFVGNLIMFCQCIEHDIKLIYAKMLKGEDSINYISVERLTLGVVIKKLKHLDYSDEEHWFSESDYSLLERIANIRNFWAHSAYVDFVYSGADFNLKFGKVSKRLLKDFSRLEKLHKNIESIRIHHYI